MTLCSACIVSVIVAVAAPAPDETPPLLLADVLARVSETAPSVRVQGARVGVARAGVEVAGAWEDGTFSVMSEEVPFGTNPDAMPMISYKVMQPITPLFGRRRLAKDVARAGVDVAGVGLERAKWNARAAAVGSFYDLWMNGEMQTIVARQIAIMQRMKDAARARYAAGAMMVHHEYLRAESEIAAMQAERLAFEDERVAVMAMLNVLLGNSVDAPLGTPQLPERAALPVAPQLAAKVSESPEVVGARAMRTEARARRELMKSMYWPMVMVGVTFEQQLRMHDTWGAEVALRVPFWWERPNVEVAMADAMVREANADIDAMTAMKIADAQMALSRARAANRRLEVLEKTAIPLMLETVKSSEAAYGAGTGEFLMLLDSILALTELEMERVRVIAARSTQLYELSRLLGQNVVELEGAR